MADRSFPLLEVCGTRPGPTVALVAGVHGDEYEGPAALWRVLERVRPESLRGRLLVVPVAHLAAFAAGTRTSPNDGENLARSFPGDPHGTVTQRLAHELFSALIGPADLLVDLHSGGSRLAFLQVAGFYGPQEGISAAITARSLEMARAMALPCLWRMPGRAGVLSFEAMRAGVPATGCEAGGRGGCLDADVEAYTRGVLGVLAQQGMIERPGDVPLPSLASVCLDGDFALAPCGGFLEPLVTLGDRVRSGDALARIRAPIGEELCVLRAQADGLVMAERHLRSIQIGEWATCAVREVPL